MEELSLEQKAQRYDEALEYAKSALDCLADDYICNHVTKDDIRGMYAKLFPKLKESEDEEIRKELISHFCGIRDSCGKDWYGYNINDVIAWLEKQGEQKPADKVEPKFHEGDWIVHHGTKNIYQVVAVINNQYQLKYGDNYTIQNCADVDRCARLFKFSNYIKPVKV